MTLCIMPISKDSWYIIIISSNISSVVSISIIIPQTASIGIEPNH